MDRTANQNRRPTGFTLVELMIAITIASVLTMIALPAVRDALRQNVASRGASLVKGAFVNAQAQAIRTGRPFGVLIERMRGDIGSGSPAGLNYTIGNYATRMYYVQTPLAYRGDTEDSAAYYFIDTLGNKDSTDDVPRFFIPQSEASLLYASADGGAVASRIISTGTQMSIGGSGHKFTITGLQVFNSGLPANRFNSGVQPSWAAVAGTVVAVNFGTVVPTYQPVRDFADQQGYSFSILSLPTRAPLAPISLIGRTIIDLSISGSSTNPFAFGTQAIVGGQSVPAEYTFGDIIIMFAPNGRVDGVYMDQQNPTSPTGFSYGRVIPTSAISVGVGYADGIVDNIDDIARYPENIPGTVFPTSADDPPLAAPAPPQPLEFDAVPNFANPEGAWVTLKPLSGAVSIDTIAAQPDSAYLSAYYGFDDQASPPSRQVAAARLLQSRRLSTAGVTE